MEPWKYFNRYGRAAGMFLRASKSLEQYPRILRGRSGLFLRTSRGNNKNGFFLRTAKAGQDEDEELIDDLKRSNTGMFLRNF